MEYQHSLVEVLSPSQFFNDSIKVSTKEKQPVKKKKRETESCPNRHAPKATKKKEKLNPFKEILK